MKIDFTQKIIGLDGEPMMDGEKPLTLADMTVAALLGVLPGPRGEAEQLSGEAKVRHAVIAQDVYKAEEPLDLKVDDISLIKDRIGRSFGPLPVMRAWTMLEGEEA